MEDSVIEEEDLSLSGLGDSEPDNEREKKVVMDAEEILRECNRMMLQLQEEEEADQELLEKIQRGESSEEEIQLEIIRLQKQVKASSNDFKKQSSRRISQQMRTVQKRGEGLVNSNEKKKSSGLLAGRF